MVTSHLWSLRFPNCKEGMTLTTLLFLSGLRALSGGLARKRDPGSVTEEKPLWKWAQDKLPINTRWLTRRWIQNIKK